MQRFEIWRCNKFEDDEPTEPLWSMVTDDDSDCLVTRSYVNDELYRETHT